MKRLLFALGLVVMAATPAEAARDIRVVLDLSQSMRKNDPGRLAILSTLLLHDLAKPNTTLGDSFEVIPFDLHWQWPDPAALPPVSTQPRIQAQLGGRADFERALQSLKYDAAMTYFYPGIAAALQDLELKGSRTYDERTIVLITDGVPEAPTRDAELQRIRNDLVPRLERSGIRLYVLAFGGEADQNRNFFADMVQSTQGTSLGDVFVDPQGTQLLDFMLQLFSRSFGFTRDTSHRVPGTSVLDLEANTTPERVAVTVFSSAPAAPALQLTPPAQGGSVSMPGGLQSASAPGGSYSLLWVLQPSRGQYGFASDAVNGTAAVLRPTRLAIEILPSSPGAQIDQTLAQTPFRLKVLVSSPTGAQGDPGPADLSFRIFGERIRNPGSTTTGYAWESEPMPPSGPAKVTAQGREYEIVVEFPEHPEKPDSVYAGHIEVQARRGEAIVGELARARAHRIEVHPLLAIAPQPLGAYASPQAIQRRQTACTQFNFQLTAGRLPHPDRPSYAIRAVLTAADKGVLTQELNQASFTLDGLPLLVEGKPAEQPSAWQTGRKLTPEAFLGPHRLCTQIGKPTRGEPARPIELQLRTTLLDDPYDEFGVIRPFQLKVPVAPPGLWQKWRLFILGGVALATLLGLLWYLRDRPVLPDDLGYAIGREDSAAALASQPLHRSPSAELFGLVAESAVIAPGEDRALGRIRPADEELFQFRPARGVHLETAERELVPLRRGLATIAVHRPYRLRTERGAYLFRMEYR